MDRSQFQLTARELLERHIAESTAPTRPEGHPGDRYAQGVGDYVSETTAARKNDAMINREFHAFNASTQTEIKTAAGVLEKHIENTQTQAERSTAAGDALNNELKPRHPNYDVLNKEHQAALEKHMADGGRDQGPKPDSGRKGPDIDI